jgi:hypothetical protein
MRPLSWTVTGYREVVAALRARLPWLAWDLARLIERKAGIPKIELLRRAWARSLGLAYRPTCHVGRCIRTADPGAPWCAEHRPAVARLAA